MGQASERSAVIKNVELDHPDDIDEIEGIGKTSSFRAYIQHLFPLWCLCPCCKKNKRERILEKCRA